MGREMGRDGNSAFISRGTGREMGQDGKWDRTGNGTGQEFAFISCGTGRDGKWDVTRAGLMNRALAWSQQCHNNQYPQY